MPEPSAASSGSCHPWSSDSRGVALFLFSVRFGRQRAAHQTGATNRSGLFFRIAVGHWLVADRPTKRTRGFAILPEKCSPCLRTPVYYLSDPYIVCFAG